MILKDDVSFKIHVLNWFRNLGITNNFHVLASFSQHKSNTRYYNYL